MKSSKPSVGFRFATPLRFVLRGSCPHVALHNMWRTSVLIIWHTRGSGSRSSGLSDHQVLSRRFNDVHRQGPEAVDR
jgi:hypothetical protein